MNLDNLEELIKYHPYHICTFADFANVTQDLLEAALKGEEVLELIEVCEIAKYVQVPYQVLTCANMIMLSKERYRHRAMIERLNDNLYEILKAEKGWSKEAARYMRYNRNHLVSLMTDFQNGGEVTYCRYLGVKHELEDYLLFIECEKQKTRGRAISV